MAVDEAGKKRSVSQVERGRPRRDRQPRPDVANARAFDDHHAVFDHPVRAPVEDPGGFERDDGRGGR